MTAEERVTYAGYEDVILLSDYSYDDALIGITEDNRAVYDYEKMVEWLVSNTAMDDAEAAEWIAYNTIRAIEYAGSDAPIIMYRLD